MKGRMMNDPIAITRTAADVGAMGLTAAALLEMAPKIAAVLSIVWLVIQICDWGWKKFKTRGQ